MAARTSTFPARVFAAALLVVAITATGVATASAEGESAPAGPGREIAAGIATGDSHACALLYDATVKCWGANTVGQLGLGDTASRGDAAGEMGADLASVDLGPGRTGTAIAAGGSHTCALLDNATVKCWGANNVGQLGLGDTAARGDAAGEMGAGLASVDLGPGRTATAIVAGSSHTCALLDNATVKCWGYNGNGRLGLGDTARRGDKPNQMGANLPSVDLGPGRTATAVTAGNDHTCALLDDATVKCWGRNLSGQLGQGDTADRGDAAGEMGASLASVDLGPGRTGTAIAGGSNHSCALLDDATVKCWGASNAGQLGQGDTVSRGDNAGEMGANLPIVDLGRAAPSPRSPAAPSTRVRCSTTQRSSAGAQTSPGNSARATTAAGATTPVRWAPTLPRLTSGRAAPPQPSPPATPIRVRGSMTTASSAGATMWPGSSARATPATGATTPTRWAPTFPRLTSAGVRARVCFPSRRPA